MKVEIRYEPDDEIDPAAAHLLAEEIKASDQFGPYDTVTVRAITVNDRLADSVRRDPMAGTLGPVSPDCL